MFAWLPAQHLQRLPAGGLGAVLSEQWVTSGCSPARARWLPDGSIETDAGVQELVLPKAVHQWTGLIKSAAAKAGAPAQLVAGIMATESGGQPQAHSSCCYGLMGFLPATASWVAGRTVTPEELLSNTTLNVELGAKLIRQLLDKYQGNPIKVALSYNAGSVKCGAPKACSDAPNQWNAITDCAQGKAVDYPVRMFGYSNAWHKLYGKTKLDLNLNLKFGPSFYLEVALKTAAVMGIGYLAYKGLSGSKVLKNPFAESRCCVCGGPIVSHARRLPVWMHDNSGGWYAGREIDHDACGPDELCANPWRVK